MENYILKCHMLTAHGIKVDPQALSSESRARKLQTASLQTNVELHTGNELGTDNFTGVAELVNFDSHTDNVMVTDNFTGVTQLPSVEPQTENELIVITDNLTNEPQE